MLGWIEIHHGYIDEWVPDPDHLGVQTLSRALRPGDKCRWVRMTECRLADDSQAFQDFIDLSSLPPPPSWFSAPQGSVLHDSVEWITRMETRSMQASCEEILGFYEELVVAHGLVVQDQPGNGRHSPSVSPHHAVLHLLATSEEYRFDIVIFGYRGTAFWTIQHAVLNPKAEKPPRPPDHLLLAGEVDGRTLLRHPSTQEEFWVPTAALVDTQPPELIPQKAPEEETILWGSLPEWVQFTLEPGGKGALRKYTDLEGRETWGASTAARHNDCNVCMLEICIETLRARGFTPNASAGAHGIYYVSALQGGASLNLHVQSEAGDRGGVCSLSTLGHMSLSVRYTPAKGTPPPASIPGRPDYFTSAKARAVGEFLSLAEG